VGRPATLIPLSNRKQDPANVTVAAKIGLRLAEVLQLEEIALRRRDDTIKLLVEWSSPWREFKTSIRPALARSEARLAGETPFGVIPLRIMIPSWLLEAFLIFCAIAIPAKLAQLRPYVAPRLSSHDVIYYTGDELPRTEDLGGAESGRRGRAGGNEAHHRTQTIRIARGGNLVARVVDAPNLKLPSSKDAVANLLAIKPVPGPPPSEGLRSMRSVPSLAATLIAPPANVIRDYTRNGIQLDSTIPPAPSVTRDAPLIAPNISATLIPPAPTVSRDRTLVAPALAPAVIPPAPSISRDRAQSAPSLNASVVAPAPSVSRDKSRSTPALPQSVIPPAPGGVSREISSAPVQMANVAVVPPPVSAPERESSRNPKLAMPAPAVIAPPPSSDVSQDMRRLASGSVPDQSKTVVPPPPAPASSGSFMSSLIGRIFGPSEVVPPPPAVNANGSRSGSGASLAANVVPPPPSVSEGTGSVAGNPRGMRNGAGTTLGSNVIAPPPGAGVSGGTGTRSLASSTAPQQGMPSVVPPPPALSGSGGGTEKIGGGAGAGGNLLASNIVPPPPSLGAGAAATGSGSGRSGSGRGSVMDIGSAVAPPASGGSDPKAGVVVSSQPGSKVGLPTSGGAGSMALSPTGGDKPGLGGAGGGTGIGRGNGPGSGMSGSGTGAGKTGAGLGADPAARGGISPNPGPGGAGNAPSGVPPVPGVSVTGGSSQITLPSFGSDPAANDPSTPAHSPLKRRQTLGVDVVSTASSGGAFEPYKTLLHGEKHMTLIDTTLGTIVMEYADESGTAHSYTNPLLAPQQVRADLPSGLPHVRMVVACVLDIEGNIRNPRVLEAGPAGMTAKVLAALRSWKFQPAVRAGQPVEVTAILGFNINTDDRF